MVRITRKVAARGPKGEKRVEILFDTGAEMSLMRRDVARSLGEPIRVRTPVKMVAADNRSMGFARERILIQAKISGTWVVFDPLVVPDLSYDMVLGCFDMERYDIRPIPRNGSVIIPRPKTKVHVI